MNFLPLAILFFGGLILTAGDILMKQWVAAGSAWLYVAGMGVYLIGLNFLAQSFRYENIAVASTIFVVFNIATLLVLSWLYFKEPISHIQLIGLFLGLAAIILLEVGGKAG